MRGYLHRGKGIGIGRLDRVFRIARSYVQGSLGVLRGTNGLGEACNNTVLSRSCPLGESMMSEHRFGLSGGEAVTTGTFGLVGGGRAVFLSVSAAGVRLTGLLTASGVHIMIIDGVVSVLRVLTAGPSVATVNAKKAVCRAMGKFVKTTAVRIVGRCDFSHTFVKDYNISVASYTVAALKMRSKLAGGTTIRDDERGCIIVRESGFCFGSSCGCTCFSSVDKVIASRFPSSAVIDALRETKIGLF